MTVELIVKHPFWFSTRSRSSAQEKVKPFEETPIAGREILEAMVAFRSCEHRKLDNNASTLLSQFTDIVDMQNESMPHVQSQPNDDVLYDFPFSIMPKSVEKVKVVLKFAGKGHLKFHTDLEVD